MKAPALSPEDASQQEGGAATTATGSALRDWEFAGIIHSGGSCRMSIFTNLHKIANRITAPEVQWRKALDTTISEDGIAVSGI